MEADSKQRYGGRRGGGSGVNLFLGIGTRTDSSVGGRASNAKRNLP
jgi:hypothetical protein